MPACRPGTHILAKAEHLNPGGSGKDRLAPARGSPLAVDGTRRALRCVFEGAGEVILQGPGAGPRETASAVLSDILAAAGERREAHEARHAYSPDACSPSPIRPRFALHASGSG